MSCPLCGDPEAVIGLVQVWCPNVTCSNFDRRRLDETVSRLEDAFEDYDECLLDSDPDTEALWEAIADAIRSGTKTPSYGLYPSDDDQA